MSEQVGWWCSYPGVGWYILCTESGDGRLGEDRSALPPPPAETSQAPEGAMSDDPTWASLVSRLG